MQGRPTGLKICQFQFHTGFISEEETVMRFPKQHLDELADSDLYGPSFMVSLNFFLLDQERKVQPEPWGKNFSHKLTFYKI